MKYTLGFSSTEFFKTGPNFLVILKEDLDSCALVHVRLIRVGPQLCKTLVRPPGPDMKKNALKKVTTVL